MVLKLRAEGQVVQGEAYCTTDRQAERARMAAFATRERQRVRGAEGEAQPVAYVPRRDVLVAMAQDGRLRGEQLRAGREIAEHWHSVTRALHARCGLYAERMPKGAEVAEHPLVQARTARYAAWAEWAGTQVVTPAISLVDLTLDMAVDGLSPRGVRAKRGISDTRALRLLQRSLWQYALLAGWAEEKTIAQVA
jgi:hypothetical protein